MSPFPDRPCSALHLPSSPAFCSQASPLSLIVLLMPRAVVLAVVTLPMLIPSGLVTVLMRLNNVTLHACHTSLGLQRLSQAQQQQMTCFKGDHHLPAGAMSCP